MWDQVEKFDAIHTSLWLRLQNAEPSTLVVYAALAVVSALSLLQLKKPSTVGATFS